MLRHHFWNLETGNLTLFSQFCSERHPLPLAQIHAKCMDLKKNLYVRINKYNLQHKSGDWKPNHPPFPQLPTATIPIMIPDPRHWPKLPIATPTSRQQLPGPSLGDEVLDRRVPGGLRDGTPTPTLPGKWKMNGRNPKKWWFGYLEDEFPFQKLGAFFVSSIR